MVSSLLHQNKAEPENTTSSAIPFSTPKSFVLSPPLPCDGAEKEELRAEGFINGILNKSWAMQTCPNCTRQKDSNASQFRSAHELSLQFCRLARAEDLVSLCGSEKPNSTCPHHQDELVLMEHPQEEALCSLVQR